MLQARAMPRALAPNSAALNGTIASLLVSGSTRSICGNTPSGPQVPSALTMTLPVTPSGRGGILPVKSA